MASLDVSGWPVERVKVWLKKNGGEDYVDCFKALNGTRLKVLTDTDLVKVGVDEQKVRDLILWNVDTKIRGMVREPLVPQDSPADLASGVEHFEHFEHIKKQLSELQEQQQQLHEMDRNHVSRVVASAVTHLTS